MVMVAVAHNIPVCIKSSTIDPKKSLCKSKSSKRHPSDVARRYSRLAWRRAWRVLQVGKLGAPGYLPRLKLLVLSGLDPKAPSNELRTAGHLSVSQGLLEAFARRRKIPREREQSIRPNDLKMTSWLPSWAWMCGVMVCTCWEGGCCGVLERFRIVWGCPRFRALKPTVGDFRASYHHEVFPVSFYSSLIPNPARNRRSHVFTTCTKNSVKLSHHFTPISFASLNFGSLKTDLEWALLSPKVGQRHGLMMFDQSCRRNWWQTSSCSRILHTWGHKLFQLTLENRSSLSAIIGNNVGRKLPGDMTAWCCFDTTTSAQAPFLAGSFWSMSPESWCAIKAFMSRTSWSRTLSWLALVFFNWSFTASNSISSVCRLWQSAISSDRISLCSAQFLHGRSCSICSWSLRRAATSAAKASCNSELRPFNRCTSTSSSSKE